jgi:IclR family acetate operon transcriptional repressor
MTATPMGPRRVQSVDRAFDVLNCLADGPKRISDLAAATNSSKATVHHILATLEARRIVTQERDSFRYRLAWGLYELGTKVLRDAGLNSLIAPSLSALAERVGETTLFSVEEGGSALVLMRGESTTSTLVANNAPGRRVPLHATATGKVILAFKPGAFDSLSATLRKFTDHTVTSHEALEKQVAHVRQRGFSTCWDEHEMSLSSIGVPVLDRHGDLIGAVTIAAPSGRMNRQNYGPYLDSLRICQQEIHDQTGGSSSLVVNG